MRQAEIKLKRVESQLKQLVPEALGTLDDLAINSLNITDVVCSRGRYDARVFVDPDEFAPEQRDEILRRLKKISSYITEYIKDAEGWYRAPNFTFEFDDNLERMNRLDMLFEQIKRDNNA